MVFMYFPSQLPQKHPNPTKAPFIFIFFTLFSGPERLYGLYEQVSYNCFIAAGLYALLGGFSLCQTRLNKRKEYMVR